MTGPRFSVVVPAHNEATTLPATLASLAAQRTSASVEIIVVDNASTDDTAAIARAAGVRVVSEERLGVCRARQSGVDAARGEIVVSTDADTTHPTDWLSKIDSRFAEAERTGTSMIAVAGPCRYVEAPWWASIFPPLWFTGIDLITRITGRVCYLTATNVAFRRVGFGGYDVTLHQGGDEVDLLRSLRKTGPVSWDPTNVVATSSRRIDQGLAHTVLISYGWYYVAQRRRMRLASRRGAVPAPAIRATDATRSAGYRRRWRAVSGAALLLIFAFRWSGHHRSRRRQRTG